MINKISIYLSFIFLFFIYISEFVYSEGCKYQGQIEQCVSANDNGTTRSIEDFVCIVGTNEEITYQIVLDTLFKNLDDQMDKYIEDLEKEKNRYFGRTRKKTFIDGLNEIDLQKKYFYKEYSSICGATIMEEVVSCYPDKKTSTQNSKKYFQESDCMLLVDKKLEIFDEITFSIMMLNKQQIKADDKKMYDQGQRTNYDNLLDIMMINLGYAERIWQKWPSKIQNAY
ncbi:MAG: hypothetical protein Q8K30_00795 [Candidatus Gracilibacteria bacterium]|nr:hypothetical protein [Candidatus Gracilibacteria bacterium]